ncbi:urea ABC transporter permease subunit UrtC [Nocardioides phosphati]|uniref:Urea ABC transporter permease subunit UrtC n=1 Tax=Nocardioides phosphati TaxID=1867775 RepID=A0ABQ2NBS2_9ACTN|nr:urea ABC transporter permease subunit UrtC [Nocardioides phosphati]GGO91896.1 urea ABC transporter permease subunit UrtC [Nocardioides phosphati]
MITRLKSSLPLLGIAALALALLVVAPAVLSDLRLNNLAKYCCWAMVAVGIGLTWGRGGMLVMGQGVFFALGAYAMGMHMQLESVGDGGIPTFMILYDPLAPLPAFWEPFRSGVFTIAMIVVAPVVVASILGFAIFKRRVKGAYFAILTQALAVALATLISGTIKYTGGDTGLSGFTSFFGYTLDDPLNRRLIFTITATLLIGCLVVVWQLYRSRFGELLVATRDAEERVRFLGYDPANVKLVAFVVAAVMASIGGAMFVPIAGIMAPKSMDAAASIFFIAGVALGGRAALFGPVLGALAVGYGQSTLSEQWPGTWIYVLGLLFVVVTIALPGGIASLATRGAGVMAGLLVGRRPSHRKAASA